MSDTAAPEWKVLAHDPLEQVTENFWRLVGDLPGAPGKTVRRTMTVVRRRDGGLVLHSVIACDEATMRQLEALGEPRQMLVPGKLHRLDAAAYLARYPQLRVYTPEGARTVVEEKVAVHGTYADFPADDTVRVELVDGMERAEGLMWVRSADGLTLVLNDVMFDAHEPEGGVAKALAGLLGVGPGPRVAWPVKWRAVEDAPAVHAHLLRLADTPELVRLVVAHDKMEVGPAAAEALREAAATLAPKSAE
jgi:hypothetical protein